MPQAIIDIGRTGSRKGVSFYACELACGHVVITAGPRPLIATMLECPLCDAPGAADNAASTPPKAASNAPPKGAREAPGPQGDLFEGWHPAGDGRGP